MLSIGQSVKNYDSQVNYYVEDGCKKSEIINEIEGEWVIGYVLIMDTRRAKLAYIRI